MAHALPATYWSVLGTRLGQERRAAHHIERQGFEFYLPEFITLTRAQVRRRSLLFPGYIFVKIKSGWSVLASTRGISRMFMCGDTPARMRRSDIEVLKLREDADGFVCLSTPVELGERVKIGEAGGGFDGLVGVVDGFKPDGRVSVLLNLLGRAVRGEFDEAALIQA